MLFDLDFSGNSILPLASASAQSFAPQLRSDPSFAAYLGSSSAVEPGDPVLDAEGFPELVSGLSFLTVEGPFLLHSTLRAALRAAAGLLSSRDEGYSLPAARPRLLLLLHLLHGGRPPRPARALLLTQLRLKGN